MSLIVNGHQHFLDNTLHFFGHSREAPAQEKSQMRREVAQKTLIGRCIAGKTVGKEASEALLFINVSQLDSSLEMTFRLQAICGSEASNAMCYGDDDHELHCVCPESDYSELTETTR